MLATVLHCDSRFPALDLQITDREVEVSVQRINDLKNWKRSPWPEVILFFFGRDRKWDLEQAAALAPLVRQAPNAPAPLPVLPISFRPRERLSPGDLHHLKAADWQRDRKVIADRTKALLGLQMRRPDAEIFLSHTTRDGASAVFQLSEHLQKAGYRTFLDEERSEHDDHPPLQIGGNISRQLRDRIKRAAALLVLDTPRAPESYWMKWEIDEATKYITPRFPILLNPDNPANPMGRFRALTGIGYRTQLVGCKLSQSKPFTPRHLDQIVDSLDRYLRDVYTRQSWKVRAIQDAFVRNGWSWESKPNRRSIFESTSQMFNGERLGAFCALEDYFAPESASNAYEYWLTRTEHRGRELRDRFFFYDGTPVDKATREEYRGRGLQLWPYNQVTTRLDKRLQVLGNLLKEDHEC